MDLAMNSASRQDVRKNWRLRREAPAVNSPERQLAVGMKNRWGPKGRNIDKMPDVPRLLRSFYIRSHPGLTAGPIHCRPFGPDLDFFSGPDAAHYSFANRQ